MTFIKLTVFLKILFFKGMFLFTNTGNSNESQNDANLNLDVDTASVESDPLIARVPLVDHNTDVIVLPWDL